MGGQALTGSELAFLAHVSRSTASEHLAKLVKARLIAVTKKRRFRYYRIASPLVARMLESIKAVAAMEIPPRFQPRSAQDDALRFARTCYDHLAGQLGVAIADALVARGFIVLTDEGGEVTDNGAKFLTAFGAELTSKSRPPICRACLDWSERRYHVGGLVGAGDLAAVPGAGLAQPRTRHARDAGHCGRSKRAARHIWLGPEPWRSRRSKS